MKELEINKEDFAKNFLDGLGQFGFGVLSKTDLEVLIINSIRNSSETFDALDSFAQAEVLRITDSKLKSLVTRELMWLDAGARPDDDAEILVSYVLQCLSAVVGQGKMDEVSIYYDSVGHRRLLNRAVSRFATKIPGLEASFLLGSSYVTMKGAQVLFWSEMLLEEFEDVSELAEMRQTIQMKEKLDRARKFLTSLTTDAIRTTLMSLLAG